eukprot:COSAG03_NODE_460_length_7745_cov_5.112346_2_plen_75_part_00
MAADGGSSCVYGSTGVVCEAWRVRQRSGGQRQRMSALKNLFSPPPIGGGKEEPELEPEPEPEQPRRLNVRLTQG